MAVLVAVVGLASRHWDPSRFVMAGTSVTDPATSPRGLAVGDGAGYDGQYFYRLALDPLTSTRTDFGIKLDDPAYRQQRILYPAAAWALSLGRAGWAPWTLLLVNVAGLAGLGLLGSALAGSLGRNRLWGLAVPLFPGFTMTLLRDLSEITAVVLVLGGLVALRHDRPVAAAACFAAAVLARETTVLVGVAGLAWMVWSWLRARDVPAGWRAWLPFAAPLAVFVGWQTYLKARWGSFPITSGKGSATLPLRAAMSQIGSSIRDGSSGLRLTAEIVLVLGFLTLAAVRLPRAGLRGYEALACWLSLALVVVLARDVWVEDWSFVRVASEAAALGVLAVLSRRDRSVLVLGAIWAALWVAVLPSLALR